MSSPSSTTANAAVKYGPLDDFKRNAQRIGRQTAKNIVHLGEFTECEESRGESVHLIETADSYLAHVLEGLGTKNLVADAIYAEKKTCSFYDSIAQCTVAMIANDMVTLGAQPLSICMHIAASTSDWFGDKRRRDEFLFGWKNACDLAGCIWGGGETPALNGIIVPGTVELSGSAMGIIKPKSRRIDSSAIRHGDVIIIVESSGIHANGLTDARRIASKLPRSYFTPLSDDRLYGMTLLDPTHIYVKFVQTCLDRGVKIHYAIPITGHGWRKLMRAVEPWTYVIDTLPRPQPIFRFLQEQGPYDNQQAYGIFNMGAGFVIYVSEADADAAIMNAERCNFRAFRAGRVEKGPKQVVIKPVNVTYAEQELQVR
jgi:phosphoribosylformylglycinamidine cyclo-ligase